jgi:hypothetical protein
MPLYMNDKNLQELFGELKKADSLNAPSFDELLARPKPLLAKQISRGRSIISLLSRIAVAASILLVASIGIWQFSGMGTSNGTRELALEDIIDSQNENILNWEPASNELLPTENSKTNNSKTDINGQAIISAKSYSTKAELSEATKEMIATTPELDEALFQNGSISDWVPATNFLLEEAQGFNF